MDPIVITRLIEEQERKLAQQQIRLKETLDELEYVNSRPPVQGLDLTPLKTSLATKRDRQHKACLATQAYIATLEADKPQVGNRTTKVRGSQT